MKLFTTKKFKRAVKSFKKNHSTRVLNDLWAAITKIYSNEVGSSMDNHKLTGKHTNGFSDIHLAGGDFILLYRYDADDDTLVVSAKIKDVIDHKELRQKGTFAEPEWVQTSLEELDHEINGSIELGNDLNEDEILDWFYDYYNLRIAPILAIDEIRVESIVDRGDSLYIKAKGLQYYSLHSREDFADCRHLILDRCSDDGIVANLLASDFGDADEYAVTFKLIVPLQES